MSKFNTLPICKIVNASFWQWVATAWAQLGEFRLGKQKNKIPLLPLRNCLQEFQVCCRAGTLWDFEWNGTMGVFALLLSTSLGRSLMNLMCSFCYGRQWTMKYEAMAICGNAIWYFSQNTVLEKLNGWIFGNLFTRCRHICQSTNSDIREPLGHD